MTADQTLIDYKKIKFLFDALLIEEGLKLSDTVKEPFPNTFSKIIESEIYYTEYEGLDTEIKSILPEKALLYTEYLNRLDYFFWIRITDSAKVNIVDRFLSKSLKNIFDNIAKKIDELRSANKLTKQALMGEIKNQEEFPKKTKLIRIIDERISSNPTNIRADLPIVILFNHIY